LILSVLAAADAASAVVTTHYLHFSDLHLNKVALDLRYFQIRWYALSYIAGIMLAYWYVNQLLKQPNAPMAPRHTEDLLFYSTLGVVLGGRLGYVFFYKPELLTNFWAFVSVWEGGMSFHGGALGVMFAMLFVAWRNKLNFLRVMDYVSCGVPFGLFLGRLANFVNGELWGRETDVPWAIIFPAGGDVPRHPSQLYEAGLEGLLIFVVLAFLFWKTDARNRAGRLSGAFIGLYGAGRFYLEQFRQPDAGLEHLSWGLTMGQTLCLPMIIAGLVLITWSMRKPTAAPARV